MLRILTRPMVAMGSALAAAIALASPAYAIDTTFTDEAQSYIVGQTGTGTQAATPPGNRIYNAPGGTFTGVVGLLIQRTAGNFVCSGALLGDRMSILTAAHCVSNGGGVAGSDLLGISAFFRGPNAGEDTLIYPSAGVLDPNVTARTVANVIVNSGYTGQVIDQNDIAVLRLSDFAPQFAEGYGIFAGDLQGREYTVAGYGTRSTTGGALGTTFADGSGQNAGPNRLRQGTNRYDFSYGDSDFGGKFTSTNPGRAGCTGAPGENYFCTTAQINNVWIADFDNGTAANDATCLFATNVAGLAPGNAKYCNLGTGAREVSTAGGDSGGPQFVDGQISSVTSFGQSYGTLNGDIRVGLQSSFGEFNGFVPTSIHQAFIMGSMVPEPSSWAMMIGGFLLVGGAMRRRPTVRFAAA